MAQEVGLKHELIRGSSNLMSKRASGSLDMIDGFRAIW